MIESTVCWRVQAVGGIGSSRVANAKYSGRRCSSSRHWTALILRAAAHRGRSLFSLGEQCFDNSGRSTIYSGGMVAPIANSKRSAGLNDSVRSSRPAQVASVRKAIELLGSFTPQTPCWALSDLARHLQIPKSTAHNLLQTLKDFDFVQQDEQAKVYRLGARALEIGLTFARGSELLSHARAVMNRLAEQTGETVKFGVLSNHQVLIVAAVESLRQLHTRGDLGTRWPLHSSSLGKAILSALPWEQAVSVLRVTGMPRFTRTTLQTLDEAEREMKQIRTRGYALDRQENEPGVCCVAAPVVDPLHGTVAAISVSGPSARMRDGQLSELGRQVAAAGLAISNFSHNFL